MLHVTRRQALALLGSLAAGSPGCGRGHAAPKQPPLEFVERVLGGAKQDDELPLVVAVHGLGDSPEAFLELFDALPIRARVVAPRAPDPYAVGSSWFPIDDRTRAATVLLARAKLLAQLLERLQTTRRTRGLPILTGFSQGGMLSFAVAAYHPERIGAALPIAGALHDSLPAYRKAPPSLRVIALHGKQDQRIAYDWGERTVERLRKVGTNVTLEGFERVGHTISPAMHERFQLHLSEQIARLAQ